jgi:Uma2 family endonuclease
MPQPDLSSNKTYTYADYETWDDGNRWELIDGIPYCMSAPRIRHQRILRELSGQIYQFLKDKDCEMFMAPCDVLLPKENKSEEQSSNSVQPDILVVCDPEKIKEKYIVGAPDWIIEILSPSTVKKDQIQKKHLYERFGVKEYWIVCPIYGTITVFKLKGQKLELEEIYNSEAEIEVDTIPELKIICEDVLPSIKRVKEEFGKYESQF